MGLFWILTLKGTLVPFAFRRDYIVKLKLAFVFPGLGVLGEAVKQ